MDGFSEDGGLIHNPPTGEGLGKRKIWAMEIKCKTSSTARRTFWDGKWLWFWRKGRKNLRSSLLEGGSEEQ